MELMVPMQMKQDHTREATEIQLETNPDDNWVLFRGD